MLNPILILNQKNIWDDALNIIKESSETFIDFAPFVCVEKTGVQFQGSLFSRYPDMGEMASIPVGIEPCSVPLQQPSCAAETPQISCLLSSRGFAFFSLGLFCISGISAPAKKMNEWSFGFGLAGFRQKVPLKRSRGPFSEVIFG